MNRKLIFCGVLVMLALFSDAQAGFIPDSLQTQLETQPDSLLLKTWMDWISTTTYKDLPEWERIAQMACGDAAPSKDLASS